MDKRKVKRDKENDPMESKERDLSSFLKSNLMKSRVAFF